MTQPVTIDALQFSNWDRELLEELRAGGLTAVHATIVYWEDARTTLTKVGDWHRLFEAHSDLVLPCRSGADILKAQDQNKTAIILGAQNCSPIDDELALVSVMRELGLMVMQLTYNNQTLIGAGCYEPEDSGVSRFGRKVIAEMNRVGMIVDLSHTSERTCFDAIEISERPVAITHANPSVWHDVPRNKSDDLLKALGESGGMLGFSLYPPHLAGGSDCRLEDFCTMAARAVELMGIDHVGIGSDLCRKWDYRALEMMRYGRWMPQPDYEAGEMKKPVWPAQPDWIRTPADFPKVAAGLRAHGFSEEDTAKIMGGNWLRFFSDGFVPHS